MTVVKLTKFCSSCGKCQTPFPDENCPECLKYWHDQWKVFWGPGKESAVEDRCACHDVDPSVTSLKGVCVKCNKRVNRCTT
mgnify:CR=1 FL=1